MAVKIDFDVSVTISSTAYTKDTKDYSRLNYHPVIKHKPKRNQVSIKSKSTDDQPIDVTVDNIVLACDNNLKLVNEVEEEISSRCKGLTKIVSQTQEDLLYKACKRMWGTNFTGKVTFDMYTELLNYNNIVCQKMRAPANAVQ